MINTEISDGSGVGNGSATTFPYAYRIDADTQIEVRVDNVLKTLTTDYTLTGVGNDAGGNIVFGTAPATGKVIYHVRKPLFTQTLDLTHGGIYNAENIERAFDRNVQQIQRIRDLIDVPLADQTILMRMLHPEVVQRMAGLTSLEEVICASPVGVNVPLSGSTTGFSIDGITAAEINATTSKRVLLWQQTNLSNDGIYVYGEAGGGYTLTRANDVVGDSNMVVAQNGVSNGGMIFLSPSSATTRWTTLWRLTGDASYLNVLATGSTTVRSLAARAADVINAKDFGAVGDGVTDDTVAIQAFFNYVTDNHTQGFINAGVYKLTAAINVKRRYEWSVRGAGKGVTQLVQHANNVPILDMFTVSGDPLAFRWGLSDMSLLYASAQPATNTNACNIRTRGGFQGYIERVFCNGGAVGWKAVAGADAPWGMNVDSLDFGGSTSFHAIDWAGCTSAHPNNMFGRMFIDAASMTGTAVIIKGVNFKIGIVEVLSANNISLFYFESGTEVIIDAIKCELCRYSGAPTFSNDAIISGAVNSHIQIGSLHFYGTTCEFLFSAARYLTSGGGLSTSSLSVGLVRVAPTVLPTNFYLTRSDNAVLRRIDVASHAIPATNVSASAASATLLIGDGVPRFASVVDANYDVPAESGPLILIADTVLTASRSVEIMPDTRRLYEGLRFLVISRGAVNGANTLVIKAAGNTKATISVDNYAVELTWRRNGNAHAGWVVTRSGAV